MGWLIAIAAIVFLASGAALAYVIGAASVLAYLVTDQGRFLAILPQRIFAQIDLFALMAMPLFILTGELMNRGGITRALIDFAMAIFGRFRGGLGHVNIATSVFFAGISGAATADAAALSNTLVPAMKEKGYDATYAAAITAASSIIGPIIPPSIILIIYGALMETSVAALFAAGIVPGLLLAGLLILLNAWLARRYNHPGGRDEDLPGFGKSFVRAAPALLLPFIILGGIVLGVVTPTEAAGIAVFAAVIVARIYDGMDLTTFFGALGQTAKLTGAVFMVLSAVACFGYLAGLMQWPQQLAQFVDDAKLGTIGYLIALNVILLIAGMIMEIPVALT
jgi:tripartite ATP-independent transporter DctM subunit